MQNFRSMGEWSLYSEVDKNRSKFAKGLALAKIKIFYFLFCSAVGNWKCFRSMCEWSLISKVDKNRLKLAKKKWIFFLFIFPGKFRSIFLDLWFKASFAHGSKALSIVYCGSKLEFFFCHDYPHGKFQSIFLDLWVEASFFAFGKFPSIFENFNRFFSTFELRLHSQMDRMQLKS